jgi:hypothetical protein
MDHEMSPTGVAVLLLAAVVIDYVSVGPNWFRDRLAFLMAIPAIYEGFNGSQLDAWTLDRLTGVIQWALDRGGDAYIAGATASALVGILIGGVWLYGLGCLLPAKASKRLGRLATVNFPPSGVWAINWKLWLVAVAVGLFGDVPLGWVGDLTSGTNELLADVFAPLPGFLLGGN